jgi:hypothetical protein
MHRACFGIVGWIAPADRRPCGQAHQVTNELSAMTTTGTTYPRQRDMNALLERHPSATRLGGGGAVAREKGVLVSPLSSHPTTGSLAFDVRTDSV